MSVSPRQLREHGCTPKAWKPLFTAKVPDKLPQIKKLEYLIQSRLNDGWLMNMREYKPYLAIDMAYNASFDQTTPTLINNLVNRNSKPEDLLSTLDQWGMKPEDLFLDMGKSANGEQMWRLNPPTFYKMMVNLTKAYVTIRQAKLFNDRNQSPLLKYEPVESNAETRILTEIITYAVQVISSDFGYASVLKQEIFQALMYSVCLTFPREVWHPQYQLNDDGEKVLQKEGIRYCTPHPTRMFWDLHYDISTFNTNTGCEYAGYWKVVPYGEILDNPLYWNRRAIGYGSSNGWASFDPALTSQFFAEVYPCRMSFPPTNTGDQKSREANAAFYATAERDKAVFQTDFWMKLVPAKYKMGTYRYPIWVRFIVASDNTIIYAEPCCYNPIKFTGYDTNLLDSRNSSLALEVIPFQDIVGNILSQILLTNKQNLASVNFYDKNILNREDIDKVKNGGETMLRSMNFVPYDSMKFNRQGLNPKDSVFQIRFENKDVQPHFQALNTVLGILERLLQLSPQESGQSASHQQSAEELKQVGSSTTNRVEFTGSFIDEATDAWKAQLFEAMRAYADDDVEAMVPSDIPDVEQHLTDLGFALSGKVRGEGKLMVVGSKKNLNIDTLASTGKGDNRKNETQTAQVMMQAVSAVAANQQLAQLVGPKTLLKIIEQAAKLAGADSDFKLRPDQKAQLDMLQQLAQQIQAAAVKQVEEDGFKPIAKEIADLQSAVQKIDQILTKLVPQGAPPAPQPQPPVNANPNPAPIAPGAGAISPVPAPVPIQ